MTIHIDPDLPEDAAVVDNVMSFLDGNSDEIIASEKTIVTSFEHFNSKMLSFAFTGAVAKLTYTKECGQQCGFIGRQDKKDGHITQNELKGKLIALGYKPEFIGRISSFVLLDKLSVEDRLKVFESELYPALSEMLRSEGINIALDTECKAILANESYQDLGFREMQSIAMQIYYAYLRDAPRTMSSRKYVITSKQLRNILGHTAKW